MEWVDLAHPEQWTPERIRAFFTDRGFAQFIDQLDPLDQPAFIRTCSDRWLKKYTKRYRSNAATVYPTPQVMFTLAADALLGPYPCSATLRLKPTRIMVQVDQDDAIIVLKNACKYAARSAKTVLLGLEAGRKRVSPEHAAALADHFSVDAEWLHGAIPQAGSLEALAALTQRDPKMKLPTVVPRSTPAWLMPWIQAVRVVLDMVRIVDHEPYLTDEEFAGDLFSAFVTRHQAELNADPGRWCWLIYYPTIYTLLVRARELDGGMTESWEAPGVAGIARREREKKNAAVTAARNARKAQKAQKARKARNDTALTATKDQQPLPGHRDSRDTGTPPTLP